jgi:hypothetical protein
LYCWWDFLIVSFLILLNTPNPGGLGVLGGIVNLKKNYFLHFSQSLLFIIVINVINYGFGSFLGIPEALVVL